MYHTSLLNYIHSLNSCSNIIILGDLNLPDANWDNYTGSSCFTQDFCEAVFDLNLLQLVNQPTHRKGNILDVILTNQTNVTNISTLPTLPCGLKSDHFITMFDLSGLPTNEDTKNLKPYPTYNYDKADWENMNEYIINFDFRTYYNSVDVNFLWEFCKSVIFNCIDLFVPKVLHKPNFHPVWFTPDIIHKLNQIHSLRRKYRPHPSPNNASKLSNAKVHLQSIMTSAKLSYETSLATSNNCNKIYKYITSLSKKCSIPTCMHCGSKLS